MKKLYLLDNDKEEAFYKKIKNVMKKEQNVEIINVDIKEIKDFDVATLTDRDLNFKHDMSDAIKKEEKQFEKLDLVLN